MLEFFKRKKQNKNHFILIHTIVREEKLRKRRTIRSNLWWIIKIKNKIEFNSIDSNETIVRKRVFLFFLMHKRYALVLMEVTQKFLLRKYCAFLFSIYHRKIFKDIKCYIEKHSFICIINLGFICNMRDIWYD